jgi:hypothetical protein
LQLYSDADRVLRLSGALAGVELYLILRKPRTAENFQVIALPSYIGFSYEF